MPPELQILQQGDHDLRGVIGSGIAEVFIGVVRGAVRLIGHRADDAAGNLVLCGDAGDRRALHLAGNGVEFILQIRDVLAAGYELVAGRDAALKHVLLAENGNGSLISLLAELFVHGNGCQTVRYRYITENLPFHEQNNIHHTQWSANGSIDKSPNCD